MSHELEDPARGDVPAGLVRSHEQIGDITAELRRLAGRKIRSELVQ